MLTFLLAISSGFSAYYSNPVPGANYNAGGNLYDPRYVTNAPYRTEPAPASNNYRPQPLLANNGPANGGNTLNPNMTSNSGGERSYTLSRVTDKAMSVLGTLGLVPLILPLLARRKA